MKIPGIGVQFLIIGIIISQISLITVSTLSYPMSTIMVIFSSFDLMTNVTLTCASVSHSMALAKTALILTMMCFMKSVILLAFSLFMDYDQLKTIWKFFSVEDKSPSPQAMRLFAVVTGTILVVKALFLTCQAFKNYRRMKKLGDIVPFSYKLHGFSQPL